MTVATPSSTCSQNHCHSASSVANQAARAWGVLRGEGRVIGAALYPLDA